jgi:LPS-assembly protein
MRARTLFLGLVVLFFVCLVAMASPARAAELGRGVPSGEGPVEIEADELAYDREEKTYEAHGQVEVVRGDITLRADHGKLNMTTKVMTAWGNVVLIEGEDIVECERMEINLDTRLGKVYGARLFLKDQNFHITAAEAEKLGEYRYRIREGYFTTCDAQRPPWKFTAKELDVTLEGTGVVKGPTFHLLGIPVVYLPAAYVPVRRERQSGILMPTVGYSNDYGPEVKTAFYWAISKDMDATLYLNYLGDRGFQEGLEYRYAFTQDTKGQARFYFINDQVYDGNRYAFFVEHEQKLPYDTYLKGDINYVSDISYTRDFDDDLPGRSKIDSRSLRYLRSALFGGKDWDGFSFLAEGLFFEDLTRENNDQTVQKLPEVRFVALPQPILKTPVFYDFNAIYTNFWRREGAGAHRWDFFPEILYPTRLFDVVKVEPSVGFRETLYRAYDEPVRQLNDWKSREIFTASLDTGVEFFKVYEASELPRISNLYRIAKWLHTIEPTLSYRYNPEVDQEENPFYDVVDRLNYTNEITYGLTSRLVGKPTREGIEIGPREFAKLKIYQSYSFGDPFLVDAKGTEKKFSNIQGELWWRFNPYVWVRSDVEFNPYDTNFYKLNGTLLLRDTRNDAIQIEYRNTQDQIQALNLYSRIKIIEALHVFLAFRYNLLDNAWVERIYGAEYKSQCWSAGLTVDDIARSPDGLQKGEVKVIFYFSLLGLGSLGHPPWWAYL